MPTFAAIDIGSNSCRLKIARVVAHQLKSLHEDRDITRLGASVFESGLVSPEAMAATLRALKRFQRAVQSHAVDRIRVVATSAMRDARNGAAFQAWVKAETGWDMEIISGLEEGRLIHLGVMSAEPGVAGRVLLVDLGGGSCEITLSEHKRIKDTISVPLGAVRLTGEFLTTDPPTPEGLVQMRQLIGRELRRARRRVNPEHVSLVVGTSGTAAALSDACAAIAKAAGPAKKSSRKSGATPPTPPIAPTPIVRKLAAKIARLSLPERETLPGIGPRRAEIIIAGSQVFAELLESFSLPGFRYSPLGLRDGILAQMLAETDSRASGHREFENERWQSVLATAKRYGVDPRQAEPFRAHALQLFRELKPLHTLPPDYENWLAAAAILRDTGKFINHQGHHRHTQYIISSSEIYGYTPVQRTIVSAIARYLGKSRPGPATAPCATSPPRNTTTSTAPSSSCASPSPSTRTAPATCSASPRSVYPKRVYLEIKPGRTGAELELWSLRKEAGYFREVFGRELFATLA